MYYVKDDSKNMSAYCSLKGGSLKRKWPGGSTAYCYVPKALGGNSSGTPPPPPAQHGDVSVSFIISESGTHHGVAPDMVWEMGHALASELGEGPSVRESFIDTPERVLVPPDFSRGTCESCIPVILEKAPMGMVAKSQFKEANPGRPQGAGSRLCGPASQLSKVCQSVCDH